MDEEKIVEKQIEFPKPTREEKIEKWVKRLKSLSPFILGFFIVSVAIFGIYFLGENEIIYSEQKKIYTTFEVERYGYPQSDEKHDLEGYAKRWYQEKGISSPLAIRVIKEVKEMHPVFNFKNFVKSFYTASHPLHKIYLLLHHVLYIVVIIFLIWFFAWMIHKFLAKNMEEFLKKIWGATKNAKEEAIKSIPEMVKMGLAVALPVTLGVIVGIKATGEMHINDNDLKKLSQIKFGIDMVPGATVPVEISKNNLPEIELRFNSADLTKLKETKLDVITDNAKPLKLEDKGPLLSINDKNVPNLSMSVSGTPLPIKFEDGKNLVILEPNSLDGKTEEITHKMTEILNAIKSLNRPLAPQRVNP